MVWSTRAIEYDRGSTSDAYLDAMGHSLSEARSGYHSAYRRGSVSESRTTKRYESRSFARVLSKIRTI